MIIHRCLAREMCETLWFADLNPFNTLLSKSRNEIGFFHSFQFLLRLHEHWHNNYDANLYTHMYSYTRYLTKNSFPLVSEYKSAEKFNTILRFTISEKNCELIMICTSVPLNFISHAGRSFLGNLINRA